MQSTRHGECGTVVLRDILPYPWQVACIRAVQPLMVSCLLIIQLLSTNSWAMCSRPDMGSVALSSWETFWLTHDKWPALEPSSHWWYLVCWYHSPSPPTAEQCPVDPTWQQTWGVWHHRPGSWRLSGLHQTPGFHGSSGYHLIMIHQEKMSHFMRKPVFWVFWPDKIKPSCLATESSKSSNSK